MEGSPSGIWQLFIPGLAPFTTYKYAIKSRSGWQFKADPYAFHAETRPYTASKLYDPVAAHDWSDEGWMAERAQKKPLNRPMSIYEVHIGSWKLDEEGNLYTYQRLAYELIPYVVAMGYTHVQLMPVMEHPLDISWGYQVTGYYAATSRFGTPDGLVEFIDRAHQAGIGVLLDWVPAQFPRDAHGLRRFDGSALYEHEDPRRGENRQWGTCIFNYGRGEVRSFLMSSAFFWMDVYHADGLRVDAVSYMLYNDYAREEGDYLLNRYGGRENIEAIDFLKRLNELVYRDFPGVVMSAEEATTYPMVTHPVYLGGLGFGFKWNMGWMHDILDYMQMDPIYRKWYHDKITFSLYYAFSENYILPLSHDEVVHGKFSLLKKMPGDIWKMFASLRALYGYMFAHPGKKLMFMGAEFGQFIEWKDEDQLDWFLLLYDGHPQVQACVKALNHLYQNTPALWRVDDGWAGFEWVNANDSENSIVSFFRRDDEGHAVLAVINFTPRYWPEYRFGLQSGGTFTQIFNTDDVSFGGSGQGNPLPVTAVQEAWNGKPWSMTISVPPLAASYFRYEPPLERVPPPSPDVETDDLSSIPCQ
jgi:1,4-alpha-glucan branching enzyme